MFLLDTNVVSELRKAKAGKADLNVVAWAEGVQASSLFLSAISILELETGTREELEKRFLLQTADDWEKWGALHDIPIAAVRDETSMPSSKIMVEERLDSKEHRDC